MRGGVVAKNGFIALVALMVLSIGAVSEVRAEGSGAGLDDWILALEGGMGVPGGTVGVTLTLDGPPEPPVSILVSILYPSDDLEFVEPVSESCMLADRLAETHDLGGELMEAGDLSIGALDQGDPASLGVGEVFHCYFQIPLGVPAGTVAVMLANASLIDAEGLDLPVQTRDGEVLVQDDMPNPTPTFTATAVPPTATEGVPATSTPTVDPDATATQAPEPTATNTSRPLPTATKGPGGDVDDSCAIVPTKNSDPLAALVLLLVPAVLLWARRRSI